MYIRKGDETMIKFKVFIRAEKEEEWLQQMSKKGWVFQSVCFSCYKLKKEEPRDVKIKTDYRIFKSVDEFLNYRALFEDSGWKHIAGTPRSGTQYFEQQREDCTDDIFSDSDSRAGRYMRLLKMWLRTLFVCIICLVLNVKNLRLLFSPKDWYGYPGLWEMEKNSLFWRRFIFETPVAIMLGIGPWIILEGTIVSIVALIILLNLYRKEKNSK